MSSNSYMQNYMLRRYHARLSTAIVKLGGKCKNCGSVEGLEFDHIDPSTKSFTIGRMWSVSEVRFQEELDKCQLLCRICHIEKTRVEKSWLINPQCISKGLKHGTVHGYSKYKCRCDSCKEAKRSYEQKRVSRGVSSTAE